MRLIIQYIPLARNIKFVPFYRGLLINNTHNTTLVFTPPIRKLDLMLKAFPKPFGKPSNADTALGEYMCESLELLPHSIWHTFSFIWKSYKSIAILVPCHNIAIVDTVKLDTW